MRLDELGQAFVVRLVMRPQYIIKDGHIQDALCVYFVLRDAQPMIVRLDA
jgi:hypothetical protein